MRVVVDPIELMTTAVTMGTAAVELADVGTSLQSCVGCAMSPDIRNMVDQIVATTDGVLDSSATVLRTEAGDLAQRALIATNDSLAAASLATTPTNIGIIGGNDVTPFTITNPDGSPATPMSGVSVIGGNNFGSPVIVAANGSVAPMGTTAMVSTVGGSWSPDQGTDYLPSPSLDGRPASLAPVASVRRSRRIGTSCTHPRQTPGVGASRRVAWGGSPSADSEVTEVGVA